MAKDTAQEINRDEDGRYGVGFDAMCRCGRRKGEHLAVRPWPQDDASDGYPECLGFKKAGKHSRLDQGVDYSKL